MSVMHVLLLSLPVAWRPAALPARPTRWARTPNPEPSFYCEDRPVNLAEIWRRGQAGWPRSFPVAQLPNAPLLLALLGWVLAETTRGSAHDTGRVIFTIGLVVWALDEIARGVNWFRRLLGGAVLVSILLGLAT